MRGSLYAISEIVLFVVGAGLLGLLLGLLIRRPRPQSVKAVASTGPDRAEVDRRLTAALGRSDDLEARLGEALEAVDRLSRENAKLEELRGAEASYAASVDIEALQARAAVVDRIEAELAERDAALADSERELNTAAHRIAALEDAAAEPRSDIAVDEDESPGAASPSPAESGDYLPPRQNPTGPGALMDMIEFEVGGAD
jgi:hypothetical protein